MSTLIHHDKNFRKFESKFDRKAVKETQSNLRRIREEAKTVNKFEPVDDYSDISDIWDDSEAE